MAIAIDIAKEYPAQEVSSVIKSALTMDARIAAYKEKRYMSISDIPQVVIHFP